MLKLSHLFKSFQDSVIGFNWLDQRARLFKPPLGEGVHAIIKSGLRSACQLQDQRLAGVFLHFRDSKALIQYHSTVPSL